MEKIQIREVISMTIKGNRLEFSRVELRELYDALKEYFKKDSTLSHQSGVRDFNPNFWNDIIRKIDPAVSDTLGVAKQEPYRLEENEEPFKQERRYIPSVVIQDKKSEKNSTSSLRPATFKNTGI